MKILWKNLLLMVVLGSSVFVTPANADDAGLLRRLNRLEAEVQALKAKLATEKTKPSPIKTVMVEKHDAPIAMAPPPNRFAGGYAALLGSFSQGIGANESDALAASFGLDWSKLDSAEIGLAAGYNVTSGPLVFGFELASREPVSGEKSGTNGTIPTNYYLPQTYVCSRGFPCISKPTVIPATQTLANYTIDQLKIDVGPGAEFVARSGVEIGDILLYSRLGAGGSLFYQTRNTSNYSSVCNQPSISYFGAAYTFGGIGYSASSLTGCGSITTSTNSATSSHSTAWIPYAVLGFGVEANYDRYFARLEVNGSYYINTTNKLGIDKAMTQYNERLGVGVRF